MADVADVADAADAAAIGNRWRREREKEGNGNEFFVKQTPNALKIGSVGAERSVRNLLLDPDFGWVKPDNPIPYSTSLAHSTTVLSHNFFFIITSL